MFITCEKIDYGFLGILQINKFIYFMQRLCVIQIENKQDVVANLLSVYSYGKYIWDINQIYSLDKN